MAEAWLRDIGKYPPNPSRLCNSPLICRLHLRTSVGIFQYPLAMPLPLGPANNSKIDFTIVRRFTLTYVNLQTIIKFYYCQKVYIGQCKPSEIFIFLNIRMTVAQSWLGVIGKYHPHPSRFGNTPLSLGFAPGHQRVLPNLSRSGGYFPIPPCHDCAIVD